MSRGIHEAATSRKAAEMAVHMIASVEPALDTAIERFATEGQTKLIRDPARHTILRELCTMLATLAQADGHLAPAEISSYSELLESFNLGAVTSVETLSAIENAASSRAREDMLQSFRSTSIVARLLQRLDEEEGSQMATCYVNGVFALLQFFAGVDGSTSDSERRLLKT